MCVEDPSEQRHADFHRSGGAGVHLLDHRLHDRRTGGDHMAGRCGGEEVGFDEHTIPGGEKRLQATAPCNALGHRGAHHGKGVIPAPYR
jgi:hypothetical protein